MRWRLAAAVPFGCAAVFGWIGLQGWRDAAAWEPTGDGFTNSVHTLGYDVAGVLWVIAVAMIALGVRLLVVPPPADWTDVATLTGVVSWTLGFVPWIPWTMLDAAGPPMRRGESVDVLERLWVWSWLGGGVCLVAASLFVLIQMATTTGPRFSGGPVEWQPANRRGLAIAWLAWAPAVALFAVTALVLWLVRV